jgi:hypothetical protein
MGEKEYRGISRLEKEYFVLLCELARLHGTYKVVEEGPSGTHQSSQTFTITTYGREPYDVMQKVFDAENG